MNAIVVKLLWSNEEDFETESLLSQNVSFKTYKMYITAIFTHIVFELCKNKIYDIDFKATLTLETRLSQRNLRWS